MNDHFFQYYFPFIFVGAWIFINLFISFLGGWHELAIHYREKEHFVGKRYFMKSALMRLGTSYSCCINIGTNYNGLSLTIFPLFRVGHPPLFIPWEDLSFIKERKIFYQLICIKFLKVPGISFCIPLKTASQIFSDDSVPDEIRARLAMEKLLVKKYM